MGGRAVSIDRDLDRSVRRPMLLRAASRPERETVSVAPGAEPRPWRMLAPADSVVIGPRSLRGARRLAPGTSVVLVASGPFARGLLRRTAARARIVADRELIVLPSPRSPLVVLDDDDQSIALFWTAVAMVPPGMTRALGLATLLLRVMRTAPPDLTRRLAPGRILIGHAT